MNVYKFLGSRDMAIHLKKIKYEVAERGKSAD